jgi:hypothetical protein
MKALTGELYELAKLRFWENVHEAAVRVREFEDHHVRKVLSSVQRWCYYKWAECYDKHQDTGYAFTVKEIGKCRRCEKDLSPETTRITLWCENCSSIHENAPAQMFVCPDCLGLRYKVFVCPNCHKTYTSR